MLPLVLALHGRTVSASVILVVGLVALALSAVGLRAYRASANRSLAFVAAAFLVLAAKGLIGAWALYTRAVPHEDLEMGLAFADLVVVLLLAAPLLVRSSRSRR